MSKKRIDQYNLVSDMYNLCTKKFDNVLICTDMIKAESKCIKEKMLKKSKFKNAHDCTKSESSSKNSYQ